MSILKRRQRAGGEDGSTKKGPETFFKMLRTNGGNRGCVSLIYPIPKARRKKKLKNLLKICEKVKIMAGGLEFMQIAI
ncbi:MAG: hypothetical protein K9G62_07370 [Alphaproteobacteria bacterium]|nr:hypothetical protein [Alphaproteobacteria bacterium]